MLGPTKGFALAAPNNDARALHEVLERLKHSQPRPSAAWPAVLGAEWETLEFTRRHAEVMGLYSGTLRQIASLDDKTRDMVERYATAWWNAIVVRDHGWGANVETHTTVDNWALDQLAMVANLVEANMRGSLAVAAGTDLAELRAACQEWVDALVTEPDIADSLRMNLLQDLRHIIWLIENADIFGVARVTAAGETVVGNITVAGETVSEPRRGEWLARGKKLVRALVLIGGLSQGVDTTFTLTEGATTFMGELAAGPSADLPTAPDSLESTNQEPPHSA